MNRHKKHQKLARNDGKEKQIKK